jgi:hypothetical protein
VLFGAAFVKFRLVTCLGCCCCCVFSGHHWFHILFKDTFTASMDDTEELSYKDIKYWVYHKDKCSKLAMIYQV